jgi:hypothetical protein
VERFTGGPGAAGVVVGCHGGAPHRVNR